MEIEVVLFNSLRRATGTARCRLQVPESATVEQVIARLGLADAGIGLVYRNGRLVSRDAGLKPGDRLALSGPVPFSRVYGAPMV
jgi:molybdopterin converting factor small subunit